MDKIIIKFEFIKQQVYVGNYFYSTERNQHKIYLRWHFWLGVQYQHNYKKDLDMSYVLILGYLLPMSINKIYIMGFALLPCNLTYYAILVAHSGMAMLTL